MRSIAGRSFGFRLPRRSLARRQVIRVNPCDSRAIYALPMAFEVDRLAAARQWPIDRQRRNPPKADQAARPSGSCRTNALRTTRSTYGVEARVPTEQVQIAIAAEDSRLCTEPVARTKRIWQLSEKEEEFRLFTSSLFRVSSKRF